MLGWVFIFLGIALVTGFFGFVSLPALSAGVAQILFLVFLGLFLVALVLAIVRD